MLSTESLIQENFNAVDHGLQTLMTTEAQQITKMSRKYQMEKACFARDMGKPWVPADAGQELMRSGGHTELEGTNPSSIQRGRLSPASTNCGFVRA